MLGTGLVACGVAHATSYFAPLRPMTDLEALDRSTRATVIARVRILAVPTNEFGGATGVEVECLRVLKGDLPGRTRVGFPAVPSGELSSDKVQSRIGDEVIVRLYSRRGHLELVGSPFQPELAMRAVTDANRDSLDAAYLAAIRRNTLTAMAQSADLVVRGSAELMRHAEERDARGRFLVTIGEHIAGPQQPGSARIEPLFAFARFPDVILLLVRGEDGMYTPMNGDNGLFEVEAGIVKRLDQPVDSVIRQIRMARLATPPQSGGH
jgi:hypothetical protein